MCGTRPFDRPFHTYLFREPCSHYFLRGAPAEVQQSHYTQRIMLAVDTKDRAKPLKYSQTICRRLDEQWLCVRLDALRLGNVMTTDVKLCPSDSLTEAMQLYLRLWANEYPSWIQLVIASQIIA